VPIELQLFVLLLSEFVNLLNTAEAVLFTVILFMIYFIYLFFILFFSLFVWF